MFKWAAIQKAQKINMRAIGELCKKASVAMDPSVFANIGGFLGGGLPAAPPARAAPRPTPTQARPPPPATAHRTRCVVFSKDRAFQLRCLLRSLKRNVTVDETLVLWRADDGAAAAAYAGVAREFEGATFAREAGSAELRAAVAEAATNVDFVLFLVDDALLLRPVDLRACARALAGRPDALAAHLRLSPCVSWSHAASKACAPPSFELPPSAVGGTPGDVLFFDRRGAAGDWNYPWDLCGGLYRAEDAAAILGAVGDAALGHPNRLEAAGDAALKRGALKALGARRPRCACLAAPALTCVTVNRVQDVYAAPVYGGAPTLDALNARCGDPTADLDADHYRLARFDSVHVGDFAERKVPEAAPLVSVLMPARDAEKTVERALRSALDDGVAEVVVVDDGSADGTADAVRRVADARVVLVRLPESRGVAGALNAGLARCREPFVARLDADDVAAPGRFAAQAAALAARTDVDFLGAGCVSFDLATNAAGTYVQHPHCPLLVGWALHFSCCVAHPTVLCRRAALEALGGYDERCRAEDYDLWLRATERNATAVMNLSEPLVWLAKAATSVSGARGAELRADADAAAARAFARRLGGPVDAAAATALRRPEDGGLAALGAAGDLLLRLEAAFLAADPGPVPDSPTLRLGPARAAAHVRADVLARLGELHVHAMRQGGVCGAWTRRATPAQQAAALRALLS